REVVAIEIRRRDHVELVRARQDLLQRDVGDRVLDDDPGTRLAGGNAAPRTAVEFLRAEELFRDAGAPVAERPPGELHDVALVHERDTLAPVLDGVGDRAVNQALRSEIADWLEADADLDAHFPVRRADLLEPLLPGRRGLDRSEADFLELFGEL